MVLLIGLIVIALFLALIPFLVLRSPYGTDAVKDRPPRWIYVLWILIGLAYGLTVRWMVGHNRQIYPMIMSWEFIGLVPFAMGFITVSVVERRRRQTKAAWFLLPWVPVALGLIATMVLGVGGDHLRCHAGADRNVVCGIWRHGGWIYMALLRVGPTA